MSARGQFRLSESSSTSLTHVEADLAEEKNRRRNGWFVSYASAFIAVLAAIALSIGVGLIVHFAHPARRLTCPATSPVTSPMTPTPDADAAWEACKKLSISRNQCLPGYDCTTTVATSTAGTSTTMAPPRSIRLPDHLIPNHYDLRLRPFIYSNNTEDFHFNGSMAMTFTCIRPTKVITLHSRMLEVSSVTVTSASGKEVKVKSISFEPKGVEFMHTELEEMLEKDGKYLLRAEFSGPIRKDLKGIYYSDYTINGEVRYLLTSQLQPTNARKIFPCFDEPALKATFNTTMERLPGMTTMSNMDIYHQELLADGWIADHYTTTPIMSPYILAFMVSDFKCIKNLTTNGKMVEICARPNAMDQTQFAASIAGKMQEYFEDYHNISYPLPKTIHTAVQDFAAGAMENWGLIIYRETALLYDEEGATADQRQRVAKVIAHELAHQWFGNLVTAAWWDHIWLNEGFASYLENLGVNSSFADWDMTNDMVVTKVQRVFGADSLASSRPIYQPVNNYVDISQVFDVITYSKGASVIRMMKYFLGEETFRWGLSKYLKDRSYGTATSADLFSFMTQQAKEDNKPLDVAAVMDTWVHQMGYPVVTFTFNQQTGHVSLNQTHFLLDRNQKVTRPSRFNYIWKIPISLLTDSTINWEDHLTGWLNEPTGSMDVNKAGVKWILGNVKQRYYYRVNYDPANWDALVEQLVQDHKKIPIANRAQIVDDSMNLGRAGHLDQTLALRVARYLRKEENYLPWVSVARAFGYMDRILSQTALYGSFKQFMQKNVEATHQIIGWERAANDSHLRQRLRTRITILACHYGLGSCLKQAQTRYQQWMLEDQANGTNSIDRNLRPVVYCHGVQTGDVAEWEFAFHKYRVANTAAEKSTLLRAMACTQVDWLLRRYMQGALDEKVFRRQDFHIIMRHISSNPAGRILAWQFLQDNWVLIRQRFGESTFALRSAVSAITSAFSTERELRQLKNLMTANPDQGTATGAFKNAEENTKANIDWRGKNEKKIEKWLKEELQR